MSLRGVGTNLAHSHESLSYDGFLSDDTNCCIGVCWALEEFLSICRHRHHHPFSDLAIESKMLEPAHYVFHRIPKSDYVLTPLQPKRSFMDKLAEVECAQFNWDGTIAIHWDCMISRWGIFHDAKVREMGNV